MSSHPTTERSQSQQPKRAAPLMVQLGCVHLFFILLAVGCLLAINTLAVSAAYQSWIHANGPRNLNPRTAQTILIFCPLLLLFLQYHLYDRLRDCWRTSEKETTRN
jgi:hypothetical protein